jgi:3-oxoadipate enol-lactonase
MTPCALHYTEAGPAAAPVLVLGSSLGTTGAIWQPQVDALAAVYRVVRYDHRGHGESPVPAGPYSLADLGGDVLALLDRVAAGPVHLGGLSLGGLVALWVAAHAPERVARLAVVGTAARFGTAQVWAERADTVRAAGVAAVADGALDRWLTPDFRARHAGVAAWARQQLVNTPAAGYAGCCDALADADAGPLLRHITAPTLVIAGEDDPAAPPAEARRIVAGVARARVAVVPHAAHLVNVQQPDAVTRLLLDFYREGGS